MVKLKIQNVGDETIYFYPVESQILAHPTESIALPAKIIIPASSNKIVRMPFLSKSGKEKIIEIEEGTFTYENSPLVFRTKLVFSERPDRHKHHMEHEFYLSEIDQIKYHQLKGMKNAKHQQMKGVKKVRYFKDQDHKKFFLPIR